MQLIPSDRSKLPIESDKDFTRKRKLPLPQLITFLLSLASSGKGSVDHKIGVFFKNARRSHLWPEAESVHKSAITRARKKLSWEVFESLLHEAVKIAYDEWPEDSQYTWNALSVFALDGSKYNLPATPAMRETFDPNSGLDSASQRHYPQCLVSTVHDVFRRLPIARTVVGVDVACEREQAKNLIRSVPSGGVLLFDRGYPSYELIRHVNEHYAGYYVYRCKSSKTFPAVEKFLQSGKTQQVIQINPTNNFIHRASKQARKEAQPLSLRAIRMESPDGTISVLLTNLPNREQYRYKAIIALYFKRWKIEEQYRDEKIHLDIEQFHSKTPNGVQQELFAILVMSVISRTLIALTCAADKNHRNQPQFKHTILTLASEATVLVAKNPRKAYEIFSEILKEMRRVKYYPPRKLRPAQPRVSKKPRNKWRQAKKQKMRHS